MKRRSIFGIYLTLLTLTAVGATATPAAHAQDSTSVVVTAPYPPPPPPPVYVRTRRQEPPTRVSLAVGATRQLTQTMTSNGPDHVFTTDSTGVLVSLRSVPFWGAGVEANYQYTQLSERYNTNLTPNVFVNVPTTSHELTGAFLFEDHVRGVKPFLALGGGAIDFVPSGTTPQSQWRGAGLVELGFDIPINRYCGFRAQGRSLFYRAPNFNNGALQSRSWVATVNPALSLYARW